MCILRDDFANNVTKMLRLKLTVDLDCLKRRQTTTKLLKRHYTGPLAVPASVPASRLVLVGL